VNKHDVEKRNLGKSTRKVSVYSEKQQRKNKFKCGKPPKRAGPSGKKKGRLQRKPNKRGQHDLSNKNRQRKEKLYINAKERRTSYANRSG